MLKYRGLALRSFHFAVRNSLLDILRFGSGDAPCIMNAHL